MLHRHDRSCGSQRQDYQLRCASIALKLGLGARLLCSGCADVVSECPLTPYATQYVYILMDQLWNIARLYAQRTCGRTFMLSYIA